MTVSAVANLDHPYCWRWLKVVSMETDCLNCDSYLACFPLDKETEQFNSSEKEGKTP